MLAKLTKKQISKFSYYVDKWIKIGLSTEECDFEKSKEAAKLAYKCAGLDEPKYFFGPFDCPVIAKIANDYIKNFFSIFRINKAKIKFEDQVGDQVGNQVWNQVRNQVRDQVENQAGDQVRNQIYGSMDSSWLSFYDFFQNECKIDCSKLNGLFEMAKYCGWWIPLKGIVIFQHRPKEIHFDSRNRLHNLNGPSISYRSNLINIFTVKGVTVDKKIVGKEFGWQDIDNEQNVEKRRIMIELYGLEKYIKESGAKIVNSDDWGVLYRKKTLGDEDIYCVKVVNSTLEPDGTSKEYMLRVDPNSYGGLKTARAAIASTWRYPDKKLVFEKPEDYVCKIQT